jgi:hypothetical protein
MRLRADHLRRRSSRQDLATTEIERSTADLQGVREASTGSRMQP